MTGVEEITTADDLKQRAMACDGVEILDFSEVIGGLPPSFCATAHPENFRVDESVPNAEGSLLVKTQSGIYSSGALTNQAKTEYVQSHPEQNIKIEALEESGKDNSFLKQDFGIASLAINPQTPEAPDLQDKPTSQSVPSFLPEPGQ